MSEGQRRTVTVAWEGGERFRGGAPGGAEIQIDGNAEVGPSPMETLLIAAAGCMGADVVMILEKMRVGLATCRVTVSGVRRAEVPRRYLTIHFAFEIGAERVTERKAQRAIDLSMRKYCSVLHSLAPDIATNCSLVLL